VRAFTTLDTFASKGKEGSQYAIHMLQNFYTLNMGEGGKREGGRGAMYADIALDGNEFERGGRGSIQEPSPCLLILARKKKN